MFGGDPNIIWATPVDVVMNMYHYVNFMAKYDEVSIAINSQGGKE